METRHDSGSATTWLGEFVDSNLETRFRESVAREWQAQVRVVCLVGAVLVLLVGISDFLAKGLGWEFFRIMAFRVAMSLALLCPVVFIHKRAGYRAVDRALFGSVIALVTISLPFSFYREVVFTLYLAPAIILIFMCYMFLPTRFVFSVLCAFYLSGGYLVMLVALGRRTTSEMTAIGFLLVLCNVIGIVTERRRQRAARSQFLVNEELSHSVDRLDQELADRDHTEALFRNSEERHRRLVELSPDGIIVVDDRFIAFANPSAARILRHDSTDDLMGREIVSFLHEDVRAIATTRRNSVLESGNPAPVMEQRWLCADGQDVFVDSTATQIPWQSQKAILVVFRDVTERKKVDRMKSDFISTVSHELRTPLTSIRGALGLITGGAVGDVPERVGAMIDIAYGNSDRLVRLINDILDTEKIEAGRMDYVMRPLDIAKIIDKAIRENEAYGAQHEVDFVVTEGVADATIVGDEDRLLQVMANLLSNAAKFSPPHHHVEIEVTADEAMFRVAVTDHGPGIPEVFRDRVFDKFTQADSSDARRQEGTGLGLSISKAIVERHGGAIGFDTEADRGTTVYFTLPKQGTVPASP